MIASLTVLSPMQVLYGASSAWTEPDACGSAVTTASVPAFGSRQQPELEALAGQVLEELLRDSLWNVATHAPPGSAPSEASAQRLTPQVKPLTAEQAGADMTTYVCRLARPSMVDGLIPPCKRHSNTAS